MSQTKQDSASEKGDVKVSSGQQSAMPSAPALEKSLLCMMALDPAYIINECISNGLTEEYFYIPAHRIIWNVIHRRSEKNESIDFATLVQILTDEGTIEAVGGASGVADIFSVESTTALFKSHFAIIKEKYLRRSMIMAANSMHELALTSDTEIDQLLDSAEQEVMKIRQSSQSTAAWNLKKVIQDAVSDMEKMMDRKGEVLGLTTGYPVLDQMINGLKAGELFVIAARPSMGKTSFLLNIMEHLVLDVGSPVVVFSCEMPAVQLMERLLYARSGVSRSELIAGMTKSQMAVFRKAIVEYSGSGLIIDDTAAISISELRAKARRLVKEHPDICAIGVDYLQLMRSYTKQAQNSREREIAEISAGLKGLAKELCIPIIVLAQLNRGPENRTGKVRGLPMMSDLRESGAIEQDADMIGLLYRKGYYASNNEDEDEVESSDANLNLAKNRNGPTGDVPLTFQAELMRFTPRTSQEEART